MNEKLRQAIEEIDRDNLQFVLIFQSTKGFENDPDSSRAIGGQELGAK